MRIFLSAGEASGDAYGAALMREMRLLLRGREQEIFELAIRSDPRFPSNHALVPSEKLPAAERGRLDALLESLGIPAPNPLLQGLLVSSLPRVLFRLASAEARERFSSPVFEAVGGPLMAAERAKMVARSSNWGAMSVTQAARVYFRVLVGFRAAKRELASGKPGLFIPIDFGYANIRLARHAKGHSWKVMYFIPPGSWRRDRQGADLPDVTDEIVTPFPWSAELLNKAGGHASFFGHPIKQLMAQAAKNGGDRTQGEQIAILPGSRKHEISEVLPPIAKAVKRLAKDRSFVVEFAVAPNLGAGAVRSVWTKLAPDRHGDKFTEGDVPGVLQRSRAGIVCSGTATLQAALMGCPMVVVYRLSPMMLAETRLLRIQRPKFFALPNILLDRPAVPELLQDEASPEAICSSLEPLLAPTPERKAQLAAFHELDQLLGPMDAITRAARLALSMVGAVPPA